MYRGSMLPGILLAWPLLLGACSPGGADREPSPETLQKLNNTTMSLAIALQSMYEAEEASRESGSTPQGLELETFWITFTATRLNLTRIQELLEAHPGAVASARNFWRGRVQGALQRCVSIGMLDGMSGPISSRLGERFGEERVRTEVEEVMRRSQRLQELLGDDGRDVPG